MAGLPKIVFADEAWDDYLHWQQHDERILKRINELIDAARRDPLAGIGQPEPLKHAPAGYCSRRITEEQRMVRKAEAGPC